MSRFGLVTVSIFIGLLILTGLVVPYGDEPDFSTRVERLQNDQYQWYSIYHYFNYFHDVSAENKCSYVSGSNSVWAEISLECINLNFDIIPEKLVHSILATSPILILGLFRRSIYPWFGFFHGGSYLDWERRIDATLLSILIPSAVYSLSFISDEVFTTSLLLLLLIFFCGRYLLVFIILFWVLHLDDGNFIAAGTFSALLMLFSSMSRKVGPYTSTAMAFLVIIFFYFYGEELLRIAIALNLDSKYQGVYESIIAKDAYRDYPLFFRPMITILSLVFMSASGLKSILLYMFTISLLVSCFYKLIKSNTLSKNSINTTRDRVVSESNGSLAISGLQAAITTICCVVFVAPTHAFGKYYIFMLPFFTYFLLHYFDRTVILKSICFMSFFLYCNILFYYL